MAGTHRGRTFVQIHGSENDNPDYCAKIKPNFKPLTYMD
jgi:hypothetical protein